MKKRIEYQTLKAIGVSEQALKMYSDSDPLNIMQNETGTYDMDGIIVCKDLSEQELVKALEDFAAEMLNE